MSKKYFIRGTITIRVDGSKSYIGVTPCTEFLTPDKPYKAIAYPKPLENTAKIIELPDGKKVEYDANEIEKYLPALLAISAQQKPIDLYLEEVDTSKLKIVGFVFPVQ